jgi:hypothetical protein
LSHAALEKGQACGAWSVRRFICAPYIADEGGAMCPVGAIPQCPWAEAEDGCRIDKHGFRERKTGPEFPIQVLHCAAHKRYFTVYPVGHVPYGRVRMAPVEPGGYASEVVEGEPAASWRGTLF